MTLVPFFRKLNSIKQTRYGLLLVSGLFILLFSCQRNIRAGLGLDALLGSPDTSRQPSVRLDTAVIPAFKVLSVQFDVFTEQEIGTRLNAGYVLICNYINMHRLSSNRVIAFYHTYDMPFVVEAAIEVDSIPPLQDSILRVRTVEGGSVLIAHYKGPYEQMVLAYRAIDKWLTDHRKAAREQPFEVYLNDLLTVKSKYNLLTDVYQFYR